MITQQRLKQVLYYHQESGDFVWHERISIRIKVGTQAGRLSNGYLMIGIDGTSYWAHRLAFLYVTGKIPGEVDHKNRIRPDNSWDNLREATSAQNNYNRPIRRDSTTGYKGVCHARGRKKKFQARICRNGKSTALGYFETAKEAHAAYVAASRELHGNFAHG